MNTPIALTEAEIRDGRDPATTPMVTLACERCGSALGFEMLFGAILPWLICYGSIDGDCSDEIVPNPAAWEMRASGASELPGFEVPA